MICDDDTAMRIRSPSTKDQGPIKNQQRSSTEAQSRSADQPQSAKQLIVFGLNEWEDASVKVLSAISHWTPDTYAVIMEL